MWKGSSWMGIILVMVMIYDIEVVVVYVGDSCLYCFFCEGGLE